MKYLTMMCDSMNAQRLEQYHNDVNYFLNNCGYAQQFSTAPFGLIPRPPFKMIIADGEIKESATERLCESPFKFSADHSSIVLPKPY